MTSEEDEDGILREEVMGFKDCDLERVCTSVRSAQPFTGGFKSNDWVSARLWYETWTGPGGPDQKSNPGPLHWEHGVLAPGPPGKSQQVSSSTLAPPGTFLQ